MLIRQSYNGFGNLREEPGRIPTYGSIVPVGKVYRLSFMNIK